MTRALRLGRPKPLSWFAFIAFGILSMVALTAWCISYWRGIEVGYGWKNGNGIDFGDYFGFLRVIVVDARTDRPPSRFEAGRGFEYVFPPASRLRSNGFYRPDTPLGFNYHDSLTRSALYPRIRRWWLPDWFLMVIFITPTVLIGRPLIIERRRNRRLASGLCPDCGYDLRGAEVGAAFDRRCPECGLVSPTPPKSLTR